MEPIITTTQTQSENLSHPSQPQHPFQKMRQLLLNARQPAGHWIGHLSSSALSTATAISALSFYLELHPDVSDEQAKQIQLQIEAGLKWLMNQQNDDGGFGDTPLNYSNISTSMLVVAALHAAKRDHDYRSQIEHANQYIDDCGRIEGLRKRYGKDKTFAVPILANCAMAGIVDWKEVSALPFEAACVPQRFYNLMQLPVVSYAVPALVAIGQAKFDFDPPWDPVRKTIRRAAIGRSLKVLQRMQPASGGYLEAVPLTSFVSMSLIKCGRSNHPVVQNGIRFLLDSFREESEKQVDSNSCAHASSFPKGTIQKTQTIESQIRSASSNATESTPTSGTWPIDTNLATWNTTLAVNALANRPNQLAELIRSDRTTWLACLDWIISCQNTAVHPFTGAKPGGWGWTDLTGAVPDADDTPGALIALKNFYDSGELDTAKKEEIVWVAKLGIQWLIRLQNRDKGWPTFCRGWGKLPFDRSGADITAHVIRGLIAWQNEIVHPKMESAIAAGFKYLARQQRSDGSWLPLWFGNQDLANDENPYYGTAKVLMAYLAANSFDTPAAVYGLRWLVEQQNVDGGWGGKQKSPELAIQSSVEETALCTEALLQHDDQGSQTAAQRGIQWLTDAIESDRIADYSPIGFYFAKLWYYEKMYPLIFATSALAKAEEKM